MSKRGEVIGIAATYHGCEVYVQKFEGSHPYPWRFSVTHKGIKRDFIGIPNQCETSRQALRRAWWRAKWLSDGTYSKHYQDPLPVRLEVCD